jgi:hypothetical protein
VREHRRKDKPPHLVLRDLLECRVLINGENNGQVSTVDWKPFAFDELLLLLQFSLHIFKPEDFGVLNWQVLIRIPVTVLERFDTSVLLESFPGFFQRSIDLVRKVHIIPVSRLKICMSYMLGRNFVLIFLKVGHFLLIIRSVVTIFFEPIRVVTFLILPHNRDLHTVKHVFELVL